MRRLRPVIVLALVASFAAPGAMALELHRSSGHHHAGDRLHGAAPGDGAELVAELVRAVLHGHHHPGSEPDHEHPAVESTSPVLPLLRRGHEAAPGPPGSDQPPPAGSASGFAAHPLDRTPGDSGASRRSPCANPPGTLLSRFCSLLL
ncbi:MAG: hypothetical protein PVG07_04500 [Acidobacteriota bacterium]